MCARADFIFIKSQNNNVLDLDRLQTGRAIALSCRRRSKSFTEVTESLSPRLCGEDSVHTFQIARSYT